MFENYKATQKDLEAIGEGIKAVWQPEIDFVFTRYQFTMIRESIWGSFLG